MEADVIDAEELRRLVDKARERADKIVNDSKEGSLLQVRARTWREQLENWAGWLGSMSRRSSTMSEGPFYVNYGRWCGALIGPFDNGDVAQAYADQSRMSTSPSVDPVQAPDSDKLAVALERCKRTWYVAMHTISPQRRNVSLDVVGPKLVVAASSADAAKREAESQLPGYYAWSARQV